MNLYGILTKCGASIRNKYHLQQAFTHPSAGKTEFERYEFLGDRVIGLIVAYALVKHSSAEESEGSISKTSASWTSKDTLSQMGEYLQLASYIKVHGDISAKTLNTDGFEALIGAIYLDQTETDDISHALRVCADFWHRIWPMVRPARVGAKTKLQEWAHQRNEQPIYSCTRVGGPEHMPEFAACVRVGDSSKRGAGNAKQDAEANAASRFLDAIQTRVIVWDWADTLVSSTGIRQHAESLLRWPATHAILTNAQGLQVRLQVRKLGWQRYISHIQGAEHAFRKPHPQAMIDLLSALNTVPGPHVLMVGDSDTDMQCAKAAKCRSFCVRPPGFLSELKSIGIEALFAPNSSEQK